ncbi:ferritin-like domain-containing protein [Candidatus Woesearchaeota archaeon]|nr:ferritin-like domain-containing protein [Candidatus Woesearchaeota archaeon]
MYNEKDLLRVLNKNLEAEFNAVKLYIRNLDKLNYSENRKKVSALALDSMKHACMIATRILELNKSRSRLTKNMRAQAMREETSVKEIYKYELARTQDQKTRKLLKYLIAEETRHQRVVKSLK